MADTFCRIVDTTVTDSTLGSDAAESVITTDADTSYVIRDIYKTDSCSNASFCTKLDLEMDGHKVHSGITNSASGSMIVPPNSTLCIKDTTGNYPLRYDDVCGFLFKCPSFNSCCSGSVCYCRVNEKISGTPTLTTPILFNWLCYCGCVGTTSGWHICSPENNTFIVGCSGGENYRCAFVHCYDPDNSCCQFLCGKGGTYVSNGANKDFWWHMSSGTVCVWNYGIAGCPFPTMRCFCQYDNLTIQFCSSNNVCVNFSEQHPCCNCWACRAVVVKNGNPTNCCEWISFAHVNVAQACPCYISCNGAYWQDCRQALMSSLGSPFCGNCSYSIPGAYYDTECDSFIYVEYGIGGSNYETYVAFIDTNKNSLKQRTPITYCCNGITIAEGALFIQQPGVGCVLSVGLQDIRKNGVNAEVTCITSTSISERHTNTFIPMISTRSNPCAACFDINPSTKLTMYGIKSE